LITIIGKVTTTGCKNKLTSTNNKRYQLCNKSLTQIHLEIFQKEFLETLISLFQLHKILNRKICKFVQLTNIFEENGENINNTYIIFLFVAVNIVEIIRGIFFFLVSFTKQRKIITLKENASSHRRQSSKTN
jgi:hypothetical protein